MTSTSAAQNTQPSTWNTLVPYFQTPVGVSVGITPVFYGFIAKSALQTGATKLPPVVIKDILSGSKNAAALLATQVFVQDTIERVVKKRMGVQPAESLPIAVSLANTVGTVVVTAPALAIFNGWTMNHGWKQSLNSLIASPKLTGALVLRDTGFLAGTKLSKPVSEAVKARYGYSFPLEYMSVFTSGVVAALFGHPFDTMFTCGQAKKPIISYWKGVVPRSIAVGKLLVICHYTEKLLTKGTIK